MATRDAPGMGGSNWKTSEPFGPAGSTGEGGTGDTGHDSHGPIHQAGEVGRRAIGAVQERIRTAFDQQTHRAADQLAGVASALNRAAHDISRENDGPVIHYAEQAAGRMQAMADVLRRSSLDDAVGEVEAFARRQPELFLGGVFAAGFLFARFLKSSADRRAISRSTRFSTAERSASGMTASTGPDTGMGTGIGTPASGMEGQTRTWTGSSASKPPGTPLYAAPSTPPGTRTTP